MSKFLSDLLKAKEPLFTLALKQLESESSHEGVDIKLATEMSRTVTDKIKELGLDHKDTTGEELYHALMALIAKHDAFLVKRIGGKDPQDVQDLLPRIRKAVLELKLPQTVWVLRHSVAKRMLRATPPKKVMKHLGYKSVDSMIKREPIDELFGALRFVESPKWLEKFIKTYKKITPSDYETRDIKIVVLDHKKWSGVTEAFVHKKRHNITHLKELGVVVMLPMPVERMKGITISVMPLLIHYINEIRLYSTYFKMQQVKPNFGETLIETLIADTSKKLVMAGAHVHWRVIQRYFGKLENERHPEIFEPHVQPEDLHWRKAEEVIYKLEPALHFWHNLDFVAKLEDTKPVSFNMMDIAISYVNNLSYEKRAVYHFRESLWNEIFMRYMGHENLEAQITEQLNNEMIQPEMLVAVDD